MPGARLAVRTCWRSKSKDAGRQRDGARLEEDTVDADLGRADEYGSASRSRNLG
jgi:hypothetical protein